MFVLPSYKPKSVQVSESQRSVGVENFRRLHKVWLRYRKEPFSWTTEIKIFYYLWFIYIDEFLVVGDVINCIWIVEYTYLIVVFCV